METNKIIGHLDSLTGERVKVLQEIVYAISLRLEKSSNKGAELAMPYKLFPSIERSIIDRTIDELDKKFGILKFTRFDEPSVPDSAVIIKIPDEKKFCKFRDALEYRLTYVGYLICNGLKFHPINGDFIYGKFNGSFTPDSNQFLLLRALIIKRGDLLTFEEIAKLLYPINNNFNDTIKNNIKSVVNTIKTKLGILDKSKDKNHDIFKNKIRNGYAIKY